MCLVAPHIGCNQLRLSFADNRPFLFLLHLTRQRSIEAVKALMMPPLSLAEAVVRMQKVCCLQDSLGLHSPEESQILPCNPTQRT